MRYKYLVHFVVAFYNNSDSVVSTTYRNVAGIDDILSGVDASAAERNWSTRWTPATDHRCDGYVFGPDGGPLGGVLVIESAHASAHRMSDLIRDRAPLNQKRLES